MSNLSSPLADLRPAYDVVVVGSGYGGSVVARRLAEAGRSVCVLERGLEIRPGRFPATITSALRAFQLDSHRGRVGRRDALFDLRVNHDVSALVGCGLGGTSLINANVMLQPKPFTEKWWPKDLLSQWPERLKEEEALDGYYHTAAKELGVRRVPSDVSLSKVRCLVDPASDSPSADSSPSAAVHRVRRKNLAPIAVSFTTSVDDRGVQHGRCTLCGNCVTGCNYSAKNTLIMNYLPAAAARGAEMFCGVRVSAVEPDGNGGWLVHAALIDRGSRLFGNPEFAIRAGAIFLASGSLGSTEILLRSRERFGLSLSNALGKHFSGNGDVIGFGYNTAKRVNGFGYGVRLPSVSSGPGPTIAGMVEQQDPDNPHNRFLIQEGAIPGALGFAMRILGPIIARLGRTSMRVGARFSPLSLWREIDSLVRGTHHGALLRTQTYLGMTLDDGRGTMRLSRDRLRIDWPGAGHEPVFRRMAVRLAKLTDAMRGRYVINPLWSRMFGRRLVTVHPLGGCGMSDNPREGVVNDVGEVYKVVDGRPDRDSLHKGLYVCDGSIIPTPLGVNPALTISALAERIAEKSLERIPHRVRHPARAARTNRGGVPGIRYAEHLHGRMVLNGCETPVDFFLHLSSDDVEKAIADPEHKVGVIGTAYARRLPDGLQRFFVSEGTFKFAVDDPRVVDGTVAIYEFKLTSANGREFWLLGHKAINAGTCKRSVWKAATRVSFVVFDGDRRVPKSLSCPTGCDAAYRFWAAIDECIGSANLPTLLEKVRSFSAVGAGICRGTPTDVLKLGASIEILNEPRMLRRLWLAARFQWPFFDALVQSRVWALRRTTRFNPFEKKVEGRPEPRAVLPDRKQPAHPRYELRHCGKPDESAGPKPAVVLVPGFAMSTYWFRAPFPPPRKNLTEFLLDCGYDVWLLDYRPSNRLAASLDQFTIDDVVDDLPDAMAQVREQLGGRQFQVVAHCVGSLAMLMCLLKGKLKNSGIQSMILSQSFAFIDQPMINQIKARLHLAEVLQFLGVRPVLTTEFDVRSSLGTRLLDRLLYFYPSRERCRSGVCRRLLLIYGEANRHAELDQIAHRELYNMVDRGNLRAIAHLQRMVARHRLVNARGEDVYVTPANAANVDIPLGLLHGAKNNLFRRSGALKTADWLKGYGKDVELIDLPNSGHMDGYIGPNADADVFPKIDAYLKMTRPRGASAARTSVVAAL